MRCFRRISSQLFINPRSSAPTRAPLLDNTRVFILPPVARSPQYGAFFQRRLNSSESPVGPSHHQEFSSKPRHLTRSEKREQEEKFERPIETVYLGNLFWDLKAEDLRKHMEQYGTVLSAVITHDNRGLSKGFGYVQYSTIEEARRAVERQDMQMLHGRKTVVRFARTQIEQTKADIEATPSNTLFIGNIPFELTDRDLQDLFADVFNFVDIRIPVDRRTGVPRGFAHCEFIDVEAAEAAREILRRKHPYGRKLKVQFANGTKRSGIGKSGPDESQ